MWISVSESVVEEREFDLVTPKCPSGKAVLQLIRRDARASFLYFPKKITYLLCADTGKKIKQSLWSPEIVTASEEMKDSLQLPKWGYYVAAVLCAVTFIGIPLGFYLSVKNNSDPNRAFMTQNAEEKKATLSKLDTGDLVAGMSKVYRVKEVTDTEVLLVASNVAASSENYTDGLNNEDYPESSFTAGEIRVDKKKFIQGFATSSETILSVLDN